MNTIRISFKLNGRDTFLDVEPNKRLIDMLREDCGLTSVKEGCGEGECGACTVLINNDAVTSCTVLAPQVDN
jgi:carbon-monoxide dehydrogenase small subunit